MAKILALAGSLRRASVNKKLAAVAAQKARDAGAEVTLIDLKDYPLPIYDGDLEEEGGLPENAIKLQELFKSHHGWLLVCPEYNSSITAVLKNVLDWVSRPHDGARGRAAYEGKVAGLLAASPGALGGLRGLVTVRSILGSCSVIVVPDQFALGNAFQAFAEDGSLLDEKNDARVAGVAKRLVDVTQALNP